MQPMYILPTKSDFLAVDLLKLIHPENAQFSIAQYRKGKINMRMVIDYREFDEHIVIFDESKNEEFSKAMSEWQANSPQPSNPNNGIQSTSLQIGSGQPQPPVKNVKLIGTVVIYHGGADRIIMLPQEEWEDVYFGYLQKQKLDIINS